MQVSKCSLSQHGLVDCCEESYFFVQDSGGEPAPELSDGVRYVLPPQHEPGSGKIDYHRPLPSDMGVNESIYVVKMRICMKIITATCAHNFSL